MRKLKDFNFENKRVLVRCDFNVPLSERGEILDDFRIRETIPTIRYLIEKRAKIILMSHLGRPEGKVVEELRLTPIQDRLTEYLDLSIVKAADCTGPDIEKWTREIQPGEILLLENLRFHKGEEKNDENFAKDLSKLGDVFVNEAFSVSHRAHASMVGVPKFLPSGAGLLLEKEIKALKKIIENPQKPLLAIFGGREVNYKTIDKISEKADFILINWPIKEEIEQKKIKLKYPQKIIFPSEYFLKNAESRDIGEETIKTFKEKIKKAKTIFWSGPFGQIEKKEFPRGTEEIAKAIIESSAFSLVGGGETVEFINKLGLSGKFNHLSTGGGAMLEFLSGEKLPGLAALNFYEGN